MAGYETIPKEDAPQPKHGSAKFAATVAAICLASAVAGTQAPKAVMALNSYFSKGERLELAHYRHSSRKDSVCLAVQDNSNVRYCVEITTTETTSRRWRGAPDI